MLVVHKAFISSVLALILGIEILCFTTAVTAASIPIP